MCGICGELAFDGAAPVDPDVLVAMRDWLIIADLTTGACLCPGVAEPAWASGA